MLVSCVSQPQKNDWPKTVDEASNRLIKKLSVQEKNELAGNTKESLIQYHFTEAMSIRNEFGLWGGNIDLLKSCKVSHPDDCSSIILEDAWLKIRKPNDLATIIAKELSLRDAIGTHRQIEYCPDNTCDILKFPVTTSDKDVYQFSGLFFGFGSGYSNLYEFRKKNKRMLEKLLQENQAACSKNLKPEHCAIKRLAKKLGVRVVSVTYDEGQKCETEYLLDDILLQRAATKKPITNCVR